MTYEARGAGLQALRLMLTSRCSAEIAVAIVPGTQFRPSSGSVQTMVVRHPQVVHLAPNDNREVSLSVGCANMKLATPGRSDHFTLVDTVSPELSRLFAQQEFEQASFRVQQFAIWTITDNPLPGGYVGLGQFGVGSGPSDDERRLIAEMFQAAGIPVQSYRAFTAPAKPVNPAVPAAGIAQSNRTRPPLPVSRKDKPGSSSPKSGGNSRLKTSTPSR